MVSKDDLLNDFEEVILADWKDNFVIKRNQPTPNSIGELQDNFVIILQNGNISIITISPGTSTSYTTWKTIPGKNTT